MFLFRLSVLLRLMTLKHRQPLHCLLVISPEMTYEIGQMFVRASVRSCNVNIFKTLRLWDRWADVDETWHVYSVGRWTKLPGSGVFNFGPCAARGATPNIARSERWPTPTGVLIKAPLAIAKAPWRIDAVHLFVLSFVYMSVCLSDAKISTHLFTHLLSSVTTLAAEALPHRPTSSTRSVGHRKVTVRFKNKKIAKSLNVVPVIQNYADEYGVCKVWLVMAKNDLTLGSLKITGNGTIRKLGYGFLFVFHNNYGSLLYHFRDNAR